MSVGFSVDAENLATVLRELRAVNAELPKELRKEMKTAAQPLANRLAGNVFQFSPLSGFDPVTVGRRRTRGVPLSRFRYRAPSAVVRTPLGKPARSRGTFPVVSIRVRARTGFAGFAMMELAGSKSQGNSPQGRGFIRALNARIPMSGGLGRQVIPEFKKKQPEVQREAVNILANYAEKVSRRLR
jgi:hypothetical protein